MCLEFNCEAEISLYDKRKGKWEQGKEKKREGGKEEGREEGKEEGRKGKERKRKENTWPTFLLRTTMKIKWNYICKVPLRMTGTKGIENLMVISDDVVIIIFVVIIKP